MNENTLKAEAGIGLALRGAYKIQVVNATTKEVVADYGWQKNLILNAGMDAIAVSASLASVNAVGIVGTGTRANTITGSTSQITQSGAQLFLVDNTGMTGFTSSIYTGYASAVQVGDVIIDSDGSESMVRSIIDEFNVRVDNSSSYSTGKNFVVFKTSQTRLQTEVHRSSTYLVGSSSAVGWNCGTVVSESQVTMRRTYDFTAEVSPQVYTEGGVSWTGTANAQVFARYVFPYAVAVGIGFQLRMVHDFVARFTPIVEHYLTPTITNWPVAPSTTTAGSQSIQDFLYPSVNTSGGGSANCLDPAVFGPVNPSYGGTYASIFVSEDTTPLSPFGSSTTRGTNVTYQAASAVYGYTPGTYEYVKGTTFNIYAIPSTNIYSIGIGIHYIVFPSVFYYPYQATHQVFCFKFQQPQTKTNIQQLFVAFKWTWDRVLDH